MWVGVYHEMGATEHAFPKGMPPGVLQVGSHFLTPTLLMLCSGEAATAAGPTLLREELPTGK